MDCILAQRDSDGSILIVLDNVQPLKHFYVIEWRTRHGIAIRMSPRGAKEVHHRLGQLLADVSLDRTCGPSESINAHRHPVERNRWIYDLYFCGHCGGHVPVFRDLGPPEQAVFDTWLSERPHYPVIAAATGMSDELAKSWVLHWGKVPPRSGRWNSAPCPKCERWLRNPSARQCFHCGADWH